MLYMKIQEIIHIKILNKTATTQKTCMKITPTIMMMNKVIKMGHLSDNPRRHLQANNKNNSVGKWTSRNIGKVLR